MQSRMVRIYYYVAVVEDWRFKVHTMMTANAIRKPSPARSYMELNSAYVAYLACAVWLLFSSHFRSEGWVWNMLNELRRLSI